MPTRIKKPLHTVFKGYIDDSGNEEIFTLSCIIGKGSNWDFFMGDWKSYFERLNKSLRLQNRKEIERYKAADCSSCLGDFEGWSIDEQKALTSELLKIFEKPANALDAWGYSIYLDALVAEIPDTAPNPRAFGYALLLEAIMYDIGDAVEEANDKASMARIKIPLIHDRDRHDAILLRSFNSTKANPNFSYGSLFPSITPMGWEECPPLQAADLLAYENFKESERQKTGGKRRYTLCKLIEGPHFGAKGAGYDYKSIANLRQYLTPELRAQILLDANIK